MGDDYSGPVTVAADDGRWQRAGALAFADALGWRTSTCGRKRQIIHKSNCLFMI